MSTTTEISTQARKLLSGHRIGFIGAGNMAEAMIRGLIAARTVAPSDILAADRRSDRLFKLAERYNLEPASSNESCLEQASVIVLAVKPQVMRDVLSRLAGQVRPNTVVISVAAGVTTTMIENELRGDVHVVRAMPNTAATVLQSATAIAPGRHATEADVAIARAVFASVGRVVVVDEVNLNAVTGLSGSGPAYIFLIIEALTDAGVKVGLSRETALELAAQTLLGSAQMLLDLSEHPGRLKDQVTSPGGTAIAGLATLEAGGLRTTLINAVEVATRRAQELGEQHK